MQVSFEEIDSFARQCLSRAKVSTEAIIFESEHYQKNAREMGRAEASYHIGNTPRFIDLETSRGVGGWSVVLSVDLRGSSKRAVQIGPEDTYLTMHTYLPTMAELVSKADGRVGSLRGDGLFAVFGFTEYARDRESVSQEVAENAIRGATRCGKAMIETAVEIISPLLEENDILGKLWVGIGICVGDVVVTQIGIGDATERTLYGAPVNNACKASCGTNEIIVTQEAKKIFPISKGGRITFTPRNLGGSLGGHIVVHPRDYTVLNRASKIVTRRPR